MITVKKAIQDLKAMGYPSKALTMGEACRKFPHRLAVRLGMGNIFPDEIEMYIKLPGGWIPWKCFHHKQLAAKYRNLKGHRYSFTAKRFY